MRYARFGLIAVLAVIIWPLIYAVWLSFTPGTLLEPPVGQWSLRWYAQFFADARWVNGLQNSLVIAGMSVGVTTLAGTGLALAVVRYRLRGAGLLSAAVMLPLFTPHVVLGMALLPFMRQIGLWGHGLSIALAHSLIGLPVVYLLIRDALADADPDLEPAARGLGATPITVFWRVTCPLMAPAIAAGALTAFILSLNEFVIALFLATPSIETLPKVIWPNLRYTLTPIVAAASAISLAVTLVGLGGAALIWRGWRR